MKLSPKLEDYREREGYFKSQTGAQHGRFFMPGPCGEKLQILSSGGAQWEHVSVSTGRRVPNWQEMCFVKNLFWDAEECVVQYHPPASAYVNNHPNVLHLWRATHVEFPMPPPIAVGLKEEGEIKDVERAWAIKQRVDREFG